MKSRVAAPTVFAFAAIGFVCLAAISYWHQALAIDTVLVWSAFVIVTKPVAGWALTIFAVPFQNLFALSSDGFGRVRAILLLILTAWGLALAARRQTYRSPMLWALLAFTVLVSVHEGVPDASGRHLARDVLFSDTMFFLGLSAVYVISREFGANARGMALAQTAMVVSALTSAVLTFVFLYLPVPDLISYHQNLDNLRLFGVQDNPNALAKLLLPSLLCLVCVAIFRSHASRWVIPLIFATGFLMAATETRTALVAIAATLFVLLPLLNRPNASLARFWVCPVVAVLGYVAWTMGAAPWFEARAAEQWIAHHEWNLCYYLKVHPSDDDTCRPQAYSDSVTGIAGLVMNTMLRDLRLEASYVMIKVDDKTKYERRAFSPLQMGQRDRTWEGGLKIVAPHWAWGIGGPRKWAQYMQRAVGYPFDSPHNAWLEVIGGYGVLGMLLYLSVVGLFVRNYLSMRSLVREPWQRLANEWTFLAGVAVFVVEVIEVLTVFGLTIHAIWFWAIAGLQAGLRDVLIPTDPRAARP